MEGGAIANAVIAARAFAAHQQTGQLLGVVVFNSTAKVLVPLTTNPELVDSALATEPELGRGTHIYDAVGTAVSMLKQAEVAAPAIIVLSDGADTGSMKSLGQATAEASGFDRRPTRPTRSANWPEPAVVSSPRPKPLRIWPRSSTPLAPSWRASI